MNTFEEWNRIISNAISLTELLEKAFDLTTPEDVTWVYINEDKELVTKTFPNLRKVIDELTEDLYTNAPLYSVDTIADLRKLDKPYDKVYVKGYYDPTDNIFGSNFYVWYPDNTDPDDKGLTIKLDNFDIGRYKLVHDYPIVIGWFGITEDNYDEDFVKLLVDKYKKVYDNIANKLYDDTIRETDTMTMHELDLTNSDSKCVITNDLDIDKYYKTSDMSYIRNTIFGLTDIKNPRDGDVCFVTSYYGNDDISGTYIYREDVTRTMHDGGRYISPTRLPSNWWNYTVDENKGCWVKITTDSYASLEEYGAIKDNDSVDNRYTIEAILRNNKHVFIGKGKWRTSVGIDMNITNEIDREFYIKGEGEESILEVLSSNGIYSNTSVNLTLLCKDLKLKVTGGYKGLYVNKNLLNSKIENIVIESDGDSIYIMNTVNTELRNIKINSIYGDGYVILNSKKLSLINCLGKVSETHSIFNIREEATLINCGSWLDYNENTEITDNNFKCSVWGYFGYINTEVSPVISSKYNITLINCDVHNFKDYGIRFRNDGNAVMINTNFRSVPNEDYYASTCIDNCTGLIKMINNKYDTDLSNRAKKSEVCALGHVNIEGVDEIDIDNVLHKTTNVNSYIDDANNLNISGYNNLYVDELVINKINYKEPDVVVDMLWSDDSKGPVIVDRKNGTKYRLFIYDGNLGIEEV